MVSIGINHMDEVMEQLQQQGKEPTVALVKARLKTPVPMPALITAIKSWKSAQRVPKVEVAAQAHTDNDRLAALESTVKKLVARIEELEAKLSEKSS